MILDGKEHKERGVALANSYNERSMNLDQLSRGSDGINPVRCSDHTLTIWGHGGRTDFADMYDVEFGKLITNWKSKNPELKIVEIITCDSRHKDDYLAGYASRVMKFVSDKKSDVIIKGLPYGQHKDDTSILWANVSTSTFCYITSPNKEVSDFANKRLKELDIQHAHNLALVGDIMSKERTLTIPNNYSIISGQFNNLRNYLVNVN